MEGSAGWDSGQLEAVTKVSGETSEREEASRDSFLTIGGGICIACCCLSIDRPHWAEAMGFLGQRLVEREKNVAGALYLLHTCLLVFPSFPLCFLVCLVAKATASLDCAAPTPPIWYEAMIRAK